MYLNKQSSREEKRDASDAIFDFLSEYFFEKVTFLNLAYSDLGSGGTTSTTNFGTLSRIIDSSGGILMGPGRDSRMRCQFYVKNPSVTEGYILTSVLYDAWSLPSPLTTMSSFRAYAGIKIYKGLVYVVVKEAGGIENTTPINFNLTMSDATFSDNFALEIKNNGSQTQVIINNVDYGTYKTDFIGSSTDTYVYYPFFAPARSTSGTIVNIVAENIQFIQPRN